MHYVKVHIPANASEVAIRVRSANGPAPDVALIVGGPKGRTVKGKKETKEGVRAVTFDELSRGGAERHRPRRRIPKGANYAIDYAAFS